MHYRHKLSCHYSIRNAEMATLILGSSAAHDAEAAAPKVGAGLAGWLSAAFQAIVSAKTRKAQIQVDGYLSSLNDETLIDLGLDPASVRQGDPLKRFYL